MSRGRVLAAIFASAAIVAIAGCGRVDRQMRISSNPSGALVYLNGEEVGRTPCTVDFTWYGRYDVAIRKDGYETLKTTKQVIAPWWQWIPLDLLADVTPGRKVDRHDYSFSMKAQGPATVPADAIIQRSDRLKPLLESGQFTRKTPTAGTAKPTTTPAAAPVAP